MASIGVINDDGGVVERNVISRNASVEAESVGEISPSVVQQVKFDNKGQMSSITTECGETENRREGENQPNLTVEGVIVEDEIDQMRALKNEDNISFVSDIYSGDVIVERLSITQKPELQYYKPDGGEEQLAFAFQMQLKKPE